MEVITRPRRRRDYSSSAPRECALTTGLASINNATNTPRTSLSSARTPLTNRTCRRRSFVRASISFTSRQRKAGAHGQEEAVRRCFVRRVRGRRPQYRWRWSW